MPGMKEIGKLLCDSRFAFSFFSDNVDFLLNVAEFQRMTFDKSFSGFGSLNGSRQRIESAQARFPEVDTRSLTLEVNKNGSQSNFRFFSHCMRIIL